MSKQPRLAAFQYRDFRLLWIGRLFSNIGSQMQLIAINWHIFALLRDQTVTVSLLGRREVNCNPYPSSVGFYDSGTFIIAQQPENDPRYRHVIVPLLNLAAKEVQHFSFLRWLERPLNHSGFPGQ